MTDNINIKEIKDKTIEFLQEQIKEKEEYIKLIQNIDVNQIVTEKEWHKFCETPIRCSEILKIFVKNLWADAENIEVCANDTRFDLYGFKVSIPTSRCMGMEIVIDWEFFKYIREKKPEFTPSREVKRIMDYIELKEQKNVDWYTLYKAKVPTRVAEANYRKYYCWFLWNVQYKYMKIDEEYWKAEYEKEKQEFEIRMEKYYKHQREMFDRCSVLFEQLIPEINKFSTNISIYPNGFCTLETIKEWYEERKSNENKHM